MHADALYADLTDELKEKYPYRIYNSILNLQMLDKNENESKGKKALADWVNESCDGQDTRKRFLDSHLIPDVDLSLANFDKFIIERRKLLKKRLIKIFEGDE